MTTREDIIRHCLSYPASYEDYPFDDINWTVMRRRDTKRGFCWIFEREGRIWINLKDEPAWCLLWRDCFASVLPAYHMNKEHWNSVIMDGSVPSETIQDMIARSYALCGPKKQKKDG